MDQVIQHVPCCCVPVQAALYQLILPQLFLPIPPQLNAPFSLYCKSVIDVRSTPLLYMHDISLKRNNGLSSRRRTFDSGCNQQSFFSLYPYHTSYRSADQDLSSDEIGWLVAAADSDIVLSSIVVVRAAFTRETGSTAVFLQAVMHGIKNKPAPFVP